MKTKPAVLVTVTALLQTASIHAQATNSTGKESSNNQPPTQPTNRQPSAPASASAEDYLAQGDSGAGRRSRPARDPSPASQKVTYETATTKSGRTVILKSDGTWVYEGTPPRTSKPGGSTSPAEPAASSEIVQSTLAEVTSDEFGFMGKTVLIKSVTIAISPNYFCKNKGIEATHYAFLVQSLSARPYTTTPTSWVYMKRGERASELRKRLLNLPVGYGSLKASIVIKILKDREGCALELIDYSLQ